MYMCDLKKYADIYEEIKKLNDDTLQLVLESEDDEMKDFYELVGDFLLQQRQRKVVKENLKEVIPLCDLVALYDNTEKWHLGELLFIKTVNL